MTKLDLQYDLQNYTPASASPPQANFNRVEQHINQELIERDGTVSMKAQLQLVGDPVNALDAAPKQYVDQVLPVGIIMMYGGAATPPGGRWALCNGAELQTTEYPELFAVLGSAYGGTAGRFNLPNLTDKFPRGTAPGTSGGAADAVVVAHVHPITHDHPDTWTGVENQAHSHLGPDHVHGGGTAGANARHVHAGAFGEIYRYNPFAPVGYFGGGSAGNGSPFDILNTAAVNSGTDTPDHAHAFSTGGSDRSLQTGGENVNHQHYVDTPPFTGNSASTGVTGTNANLPPYIGVTYIVRVR